MSSDPFAICVENVSKCYQIYERPQDRLKQSFAPLINRLMGRKSANYYREFWALNDVSLGVRKGETVGIIGRNGSGKSTLLQIICGTLEPTKGLVDIHGRVAALLELGSGFNPEFTGRENVYMNGVVLGVSKDEIDARFRDIAAFADIGEFMDQPVRKYSSGMMIRLAFAVASCIDPDVLIVDEALAVGDIKFQAKCFRRFKDLVAKGTSILFVTHSTEQIVRHCNRAILLERGQIIMEDLPNKVTSRYLDVLFGIGRRSEGTTLSGTDHSALENSVISRNDFDRFENRPGYNQHEYRWGNREAEIVDFFITSDGITHTTLFKTGQEFLLVFWIDFKHAVDLPIFGLNIKTPDGIIVYGSNSRDTGDGPLFLKAQGNTLFKVSMRLRNQSLCAGDYLLSLGVAKDEAGEIVPLDRRYDSIHIKVENDTSRAQGLFDLSMHIEAEQQ